MNNRQHNRANDPTTEAPRDGRALRVLVAVASRTERESLAAQLVSQGMEVEPVATPADALAAVATEQFDLAMVQQTIGRGRGIELVRGLHELDDGLGVVMIAKRAELDDAVSAMREGVLDFVIGSLDTEALTERVEQAAARARRERERADEDVLELTDANPTSKLATPIPEGLCGDDLLQAFNELSEQMEHVGLAAEFNSLVRQELDLESLLRTVLEFVLAKMGPTNAAVFLPSTSGDYSLGAYVNYDCPRDTAEVLLDHLAGVVPERFEDEERAVLMRSERAVIDRLDEHADWLDGHAVACLSCRHDGECLAVMTLFRDRRSGFSDEHVQMLDALAGLFAAQLARVIHVHHRHLPKDGWDTDTGDTHGYSDWDDGADDYGMAA